MYYDPAADFPTKSGRTESEIAAISTRWTRRTLDQGHASDPALVGDVTVESACRSRDTSWSLSLFYVWDVWWLMIVASRA